MMAKLSQVSCRTVPVGGPTPTKLTEPVQRKEQISLAQGNEPNEIQIAPILQNDFQFGKLTKHNKRAAISPG